MILEEVRSTRQQGRCTNSSLHPRRLSRSPPFLSLRNHPSVAASKLQITLFFFLPLPVLLSFLFNATPRSQHNLMPEMSSSSSSSSSSLIGWDSLPEDIALTITSSLNATELCSLGSCSRHLRDLCASDCLWINLSKKRWPSVDLLDKGKEAAPADAESKSMSVVADGIQAASASHNKRWKDTYMRRHREIADGVSTAIAFLNRCADQNESIQVGDYSNAVADLASLGLGFEDVKMFLFTAKKSVLPNLVGLHHAIFRLGVPAGEVDEALRRSWISRREVCVLSFTLGRLFFGFRLPDKCFSHRVSLEDLTSVEHEEVRAILNRGAIHHMPPADINRNWGKEFLDCVKPCG